MAPCNDLGYLLVPADDIYLARVNTSIIFFFAWSLMSLKSYDQHQGMPFLVLFQRVSAQRRQRHRRSTLVIGLQ